MRVHRALEKLRKFFTNRSVTLSSVAIAGAVSANSAQAAPVALAKTVTAVAVVSLELWKGWGDGKGFVLLTYTISTDYADLSPLPAAGVSAVWKYKGIYRLNDQQVGQWSDVPRLG
jgi:hypothetical protein